MPPVLPLLRADLQRVLRDRFLLGTSAFLVAVSFVMRFLLTPLTDYAASAWALDLVPYHPLFASYFTVGLAPLVSGMVLGFLLLESREEGVVLALRTSPLPLTRYLDALAGVGSLAAALICVVQALAFGAALPPLHVLAVAALVGAGMAPSIMLFLGGVPANKLEAFAQSKLLSFAALVPVVAWFVPEPWQWLAALVPTYLVSKAWWVAVAGGSPWLWLALAVPVQIAWYAGFRIVFQRAVGERSAPATAAATPS